MGLPIVHGVEDLEKAIAIICSMRYFWRRLSFIVLLIALYRTAKLGYFVRIPARNVLLALRVSHDCSYIDLPGIAQR